MSEFNKNLVALRKAAGISQKDFAQMLNIPISTLSGYENGGREPKYDLLIKMAELLTVSIDDFVRGDCSDVQPVVKLLKKSKWLINSRGDAVKLSDAFRFYVTIYPATKDVKNWLVFASYPGDDVPVEYFETEEEAKEYILELVNSL